MNPALTFLILVVFGSFAIVLAAFAPLWRSKSNKKEERSSLALEIARGELKSLEEARAQSELSEAEFIAEREALVRRLASEESAASKKKATHPEGGRRLFWILIILVPVISLVGYLEWGTPEGLMPENRVAQNDAGLTPEKLQKAIDALEAALAQNPNDKKAASLLARAYSVQNNIPKALEAYERAIRLDPKDPDLLADEADMRVGMQNGQFDDKSMDLLKRALVLNPHHVKTLALLATEAFDGGRYEEAIQEWMSALPEAQKVAPEWVEQLIGNIEEANQKAGGKLLKPSAIASLKAQYNLKPLFTAHVELDPSLREGLTGEEIVFVAVKEVDGAPMPVAVRRVRLKDLPLDVHFSDRDSVMPERPLSGLHQALLIARVSKSGRPTASSGDLEGQLQMTVNGKPVTIRIDTRVP